MSYLIPVVVFLIFGKKWNKMLRRRIARKNHNPIYLGNPENDDIEDMQLRASLSPATEETATAAAESEVTATSVCASTDGTPQAETRSETSTVNPNATTISYTPEENAPQRKKLFIVCGAIGGIIVIGLLIFFLLRAKGNNEDASRDIHTVIADNLFFRSSPSALTDNNLIAKLPYGTELHLIGRQGDWAEVEIEGEHGYVGWRYILPDSSFRLLNEAWDTTNIRDIVDDNRSRLAILDYVRRHSLRTGDPYWQINYTNDKGVKPNTVMWLNLKNGCDKFPEFAFIIENGLTHERRIAIYSFNPDSEEPILIYDEPVDYDGLIRDIRFDRNGMQVSFTGERISSMTNDYYQDDEEEDPGCATLEELQQEEADYQAQLAEAEQMARQLATEEINNSRRDVTTNEEIVASVDQHKIYDRAEVAPQFPGGEAAMMKWISQHLRYPETAAQNDIQGRVVVRFIVTKSGKATNFRIVRGKDRDLDREAIRVLSTLPDFTPGTIKGVPVDVYYDVPITFRLK